jgi:hypothetical protein
MSALTKATDDVVRAETALAEAEARLAGLEGDRGKIVLSGGDVDAYHVELFKAQENVKTFNATLSAAQAVQAAASANERKRALEAKAKAVGNDTVAALADAQRDALDALDCATAALLEIGALKREIKAFNGQAAQAGRDDLAVRIEEAVVAVVTPRPPALMREPKETDEAYAKRQEAADAEWAEQKARAERPREPLESEEDFHRRQVEAMKIKRHRFEADKSFSQRKAEAKARVIRGGETDEAYATRRAGARLGVYRGENESDKGFELRVGNAQSRQQRSGETGDPLRHAGENAIKAIQEHALGMDAYSRHRKFPQPFDPRGHIAADGRPAQMRLLPEVQPRLRPVAELPQQRPAPPALAPELPAQKLPRWR